ncbi:uncharacterized protein LOC135163691 [Diachasmimorpha longicaudata]|uniref:uncharacterized protein LOC135163691 n=1 Tax=Diachasmimorpha longicaudata TaxID=58733 RepID=UPI0030B89D72
MFEPLLMLTFLNCFFMFSTTLTTCALWLQQRKNGGCMRTTKPPSAKREKIKKRLKNEIIRSKMSLQKLGNKLMESKREISTPKDEPKLTIDTGTKPSESETKSFGVMAQPARKDNHQQLESTCCGNLASTEDLTQKSRTPESRGSNRKSTVVMQVSTIQKVVQTIDKERNPSRRSVPNDCVSYRVPPDAERRIEFIVQNKSDDNSDCNA